MTMALWDILPPESQTEEWLMDRLYQMEETNTKARNDDAYKQARQNGSHHNFYETQGEISPAALAYNTGDGKTGKGQKGTSKGFKGKGKTGTKGKNSFPKGMFLR